VAGPGALARYHRTGQLIGLLTRLLTRLLLAGTLPGVVLGACIPVFAIPGPRVVRLVGVPVRNVSPVAKERDRPGQRGERDEPGR
jgi:hypothetical protein